MSKTLSFVNRVFSMGRNLEKAGMQARACEAYQRLLKIEPLPGELAHEVPGHLGRLQFERGQFARARRSLSLALARKPDHAEYHRLLARAIEADESCDFTRAGKSFRRSVRLEPNNPRCLIDLAYHHIDCGENDRALDILRRAFDVGSDDLEIVRKVLEGLREMGGLEEASRLLQLARFFHGRDPRFQRLWNEHHFHQLRIRQQSAQDAAILRFVPKPIAV